MDVYRGLIIVEPYGTFIKEGKKNTIIKSIKFKKISNRPLLLIENKRGLGIIYLDEPEEINLKEFRKKYSEHLIPEYDRKKWWSGKRKLYEYDIIKKNIFHKDIELDYPTGPQVVVKPENIRIKN